MANGSFHTADDAAVHNDRAVLAAVSTDVVQAEPRGPVEVDLDSGQGCLAVSAVGDLYVDLGTVERGLSCAGLVRQSGAGQYLGQHVRRALPQVRIIDVLPAGTGQREPVPDGLDV